MNELCEKCGGKCCKSVRVSMAPELIRLNRAWIDLHGEVTRDGAAVRLRCRCAALSANGRCSIYERRPATCRVYPVDGPDCREARGVD